MWNRGSFTSIVFGAALFATRPLLAGPVEGCATEGMSCANDDACNDGGCIVACVATCCSADDVNCYGDLKTRTWCESVGYVWQGPGVCASGVCRCIDNNLCTLEQCQVCLVVGLVGCKDMELPCHQSTGVCNPATGSCEYLPIECNSPPGPCSPVGTCDPDTGE
jgi:hypothetical protein